MPILAETAFGPTDWGEYRREMEVTTCWKAEIGVTNPPELTCAGLSELYSSMERPGS